MAIKTQGTQLFFIDPLNNSVVAIHCATGISGFSAPRGQIETTCLEADSRTYQPSMRTPGALTVNLNFDPTNASHLRIHQLYEDGVENIKFALGWSDGSDMPTVDTNGEFTLPETRTFSAFDGYFVDVPLEFALSAAVTSAVSLQVSGTVVIVPKNQPAP